MSGVATPPIVTQPFGADAVSPFITLPIPVAPPGSPGRASYDLGFPPLNMTNPTAGGVPPAGSDMNGILYTVSAWCAMLQAGQWPSWNEDVSDAIGGYTIGAVVFDPATNTFYRSAIDANEDDPVADASTWIRSEPIRVAVALSGAQNNYALPGPSDFVLDVDTTGGAVDFSGFIAQRDGQKLYISNVGANLLQVLALSGLSTAPRQLRAATDLAIITNQTLTLMYSLGAAKWLAI